MLHFCIFKLYYKIIVHRLSQDSKTHEDTEKNSKSQIEKLKTQIKELQNSYDALTGEKENLEECQTKLQARNQQLSEKLSQVSVEHEQVSKKSQGVTHELQMLQDQMNSKVSNCLFTYVILLNFILYMRFFFVLFFII